MLEISLSLMGPEKLEIVVSKYRKKDYSNYNLNVFFQTFSVSCFGDTDSTLYQSRIDEGL